MTRVLLGSAAVAAVLLGLGGAALALGATAAASPTGTDLATDGPVATPPPTGDADAARRLLHRCVEAAVERAHVGDVTVVTFGLDGPRIATMAVRVGPLGRLELRDGTRWVLRAPGSTALRGGAGEAVTVPAGTAPPGGTVALDVDMVLAGRDVVVGRPVELDTGPAVPVVLRRLVGAPVTETLWVDRASGLLVRRETRDEDGRVERVVAYTSLTLVGPAGAGRVAQPDATDRPHGPATPREVTRGADAATGGAQGGGPPPPRTLPGGFVEMAAGDDPDVATVHYGDGLSMLSVYRQEGALDGSALSDATVLHVAGRDVWTWPGVEPLRLVWTGDGHTWTAVTDAPLAVVEDAVAALPGEMVAHDVPSRLLRGAERVRGWFADMLGT